jgi:ribosomal protein L11 methyltransferase
VARVVITVAADELEDLYDRLLPHLPGGAFEQEATPDVIELSWEQTADEAAVRAAVGEQALSWRTEEADAVVAAAGQGRSWTFRDRLMLRTPDAPPATGGLADVVVEAEGATFGTGEHPTTRGALELLLDVPATGGFADIGCGTGVFAVAAARLGFAPVLAIDVEAEAIEGTRVNAERNGVEVRAVQADMLLNDPPPATTIAANVPLAVHERIAAGLPGELEHLIASGLQGDDVGAAERAYEAAGLAVARRHELGGWTNLLLERRRP